MASLDVLTQLAVKGRGTITVVLVIREDSAVLASRDTVTIAGKLGIRVEFQMEILGTVAIIRAVIANSTRGCTLVVIAFGSIHAPSLASTCA